MFMSQLRHLVHTTLSVSLLQIIVGHVGAVELAAAAIGITW